MTVDVIMDNSRSEDETKYSVSATAFEDKPIYKQTFTLSAGDVRTVLVRVGENSTVMVSVGDEDVLQETEGQEGQLVDELFRVDCTSGDGPLATVGEVTCTSLTVPVTLDNSRSSPPRSSTSTVQGRRRDRQSSSRARSFRRPADSTPLSRCSVLHSSRAVAACLPCPGAAVGTSVLPPGARAFAERTVHAQCA